MLVATGILGATHNASHAVNVTVKLDIPDVLDAKFVGTLHCPGDLGCLATGAYKADTLFETVNILCVRSQELVLGVESLQKVMGTRWRRHVNLAFELRNETVENGGGGCVAEERRIEEVASFENHVGITLLNHIV